MACVTTGLVPAALAAPSTALPRAASPGAAVPGQGYRLGPDDVLVVTVLGHTELSGEVTVTSTGRINLPRAGEIAVTGNTLGQVAAQIRTRLLKVLRRPQVTVSLKQQRPRRVSVQGTAVAKPDFYEIKSGWRVGDVLTVAGGFNVAPELVESTLIRGTQKIPLNVAGIANDSTHPENYELQAGDQLFFAARTVKVSVMGQVTTPGAYDVARGGGVVEAVSLAGGVGPKAALTRTMVKRLNGTIETVDLYRLVVQGQKGGDVVLQQGDLVIVPESKARVTVMGEIPKPGYYDLEDGRNLRLAEMLALAGGLGPRPETMRISIARENAGGQLKITTVDPLALVQLSDPMQNPVLRDGDTVSVMSKLRPQTIFVSGEVKTPGPVELKDDTSLPKLLTQAGGPTDDAALKRVVVERGGKTYTVDTFAALKQGKPLEFALQDGDFVLVPKNTARILVAPGVALPGYKVIPETGLMTVADALSIAGGPRDKANLKEIALLRQTPGGVERQVISLENSANWQLATKIPVRDGDVLVVPEKGERGPTFWEKITRTLGALGPLSILGL
jgi:polysaccharide export outer membrane protein